MMLCLRIVVTWCSGRCDDDDAGRFDDVFYDGVQLGEVGTREVVLVKLLWRRRHVPQQVGVYLVRHPDRYHLHPGVLQPVRGRARQASTVDERVGNVGRQSVRQHYGDVRHARPVGVATEHVRAGQVERVRRVRLLVQVFDRVDGGEQRRLVGVPATDGEFNSKNSLFSTQHIECVI